MECPHCKKDGIPVLKKSCMLFFGTSLRCNRCGSLFKLSKGFAFLIALALEITFLVSIFWGLKTLNTRAVWVTLITGLAITFLISIRLPIKMESQLTRFKKHGT